MQLHTLSRSRSRSGSILVIALLLILALAGLAGSLSVLNLRLYKEHEVARQDLRAFSVAEAGLSEANAELYENSFAGVNGIAYPRTLGTGSYAVELIDGRDDHEIDLDRVRLRSVGESGSDPVGVQLMVHHVPTSPYQFCLFGSKGVQLNSNVSVDSFDPDDGPYPAKTNFVNDFGNVGSYASVGIDANVDVYGDVLVAKDGVIDDAAPGIQVTGDQEAVDIPVTMPAIAVPSYPAKAALTTLAAKTLVAGNYHYKGLTVGAGTLTLQGPMNIVIDDLLVKSGTKLVIDATKGPVKIYATGDFELRANSTVVTNTGHARDLEVLITSSNNGKSGAIIDLSANSSFMGTIYAPNANLKIKSNFSVFGAIKASTVDVASNSHVHFDEDLLYDPNLPDVFETVSWRRLSQTESRDLAKKLALP